MSKSIKREDCLNFLSETMRFIHSLEKAKLGIIGLPPNKKFNSAENRIKKKIIEFQKILGVKFCEYTGSVYIPELPVEVLNLDDFTEEQELFIIETIEPTIMEIDNSHILRFGKVLVSDKVLR